LSIAAISGLPGNLPAIPQFSSAFILNIGTVEISYRLFGKNGFIMSGVDILVDIGIFAEKEVIQ
jgi:hypothetical protein